MRKVWHARINRLVRRASIQRDDFLRAMAWYTSGQYYFKRYLPEFLCSHKWCFIIGCNNSGTTILQELLEGTLGVSALPFEGQRYTQVLRRAERRGHERVWSEYLEDLRMPSDSVEQLPRLVHDWMRELSLPIHEVIIEKTTANAARIPWLSKAFPKSYFIGLIRNGYAVSEGIMRKGNKDSRRSARHWNMVNKIMLQDAMSVENFMEVRYEDIVTNPDIVLQKISSFLGCNPKQEFVNIKRNSVLCDMNMESISRLNKEDIKIINIEAEEMLHRLCYEH